MSGSSTIQSDGNISATVGTASQCGAVHEAVAHLRADKESELYVNEVGVSPAYRRRGVAGAIMAEIQSAAVDEGCTGCWLLTSRDNVAANALYQSLEGWEQEGHADSVTYSAKTGR